jgi:asparagine synthase (glutamine-hydrolysing)
MCGIAGLIGPAANRDNIDELLRAIVHRGPDDCGTHIEDGAALGMRRLSIIDLGSGHQPMYSPDGRYTIVFNGEIYNYLELAADLRRQGVRFETSSDTEVILRLFELKGADCVHDLRGMFAFAIWDSLARRLVIARDRLGKKPLYYGWADDTFAFGSELKSFRRLAGADLGIDPVALDEYFTYRYVPGPRTIFRGFQKLLPGHVLTLDGDRVRTERYWMPQFAESSSLTLDEAEDECARLLDEAVALRLRSDVPVGAFLSGGLDSSVIVALMAKHSAHPVRTFTVVWKGDERISELAPARRVAELFSTEHEEVVVESKLPDLLRQVTWHLDEPLADPAAAPSLVMAQVARQHVKVVLTGEGADELFGGYPYLRPLQLLGRLPARPDAIRALARLGAEHIPRNGPGRWLARASELLASDLGEALRQSLSAFRDHERRRLLAPIGPISGSHTIVAHTMRDVLEELMLTWLPDELLMKVDKMTMAASVEARAPYLDHHLVEFVGSLPSTYKRRGSVSKLLMRHAARRWLPDDVVNRPKQGFWVPIDAWLRADLRSMLLDLTTPERIRRHGLLDHTEARKLVEQHQRGGGGGTKIWTIFCFQLWYERFFETA